MEKNFEKFNDEELERLLGRRRFEKEQKLALEAMTRSKNEV